METSSQNSDTELNDSKAFESVRPKEQFSSATPVENTEQHEHSKDDMYDLKAIASFTASELWVL